MVHLCHHINFLTVSLHPSATTLTYTFIPTGGYDLLKPRPCSLRAKRCSPRHPVLRPCVCTLTLPDLAIIALTSTSLYSLHPFLSFWSPGSQWNCPSPGRLQDLSGPCQYHLTLHAESSSSRAFCFPVELHRVSATHELCTGLS